MARIKSLSSTILVTSTDIVHPYDERATIIADRRAGRLTHDQASTQWATAITLRMVETATKRVLIRGVKRYSAQDIDEASYSELQGLPATTSGMAEFIDVSRASHNEGWKDIAQDALLRLTRKTRGALASVTDVRTLRADRSLHASVITAAITANRDVHGITGLTHKDRDLAPPARVSFDDAAALITTDPIGELEDQDRVRWILSRLSPKQRLAVTQAYINEFGEEQDKRPLTKNEHRRIEDARMYLKRDLKREAALERSADALLSHFDDFLDAPTATAIEDPSVHIPTPELVEPVSGFDSGHENATPVRFGRGAGRTASRVSTTASNPGHADYSTLETRVDKRPRNPRLSVGEVQARAVMRRPGDALKPWKRTPEWDERKDAERAEEARTQAELDEEAYLARLKANRESAKERLAGASWMAAFTQQRQALTPLTAGELGLR